MNINRTVESKSYLRYLEQKHSGKYGNSSFWMDGLVTRREDSGDGFDILKMVRYQRAISNFVKILGKKDIPVVFNSSDRSYTDGKTTVVLSANINEKSFDVHAGLALHEASHIMHTDFDIATTWYPNHIYSIQSMPVELLKAHAPTIHANMDKLPHEFTLKFMFNICNFIEDRRIDNLVFKSSPGYKTYYHSLYEKYFWNKEITKGLKSGDFRTEDVASYEFRLLGLVNPATDPKALKGLRAIINKLDLQNIGRLKSISDSAQLAYEVADIIAKYILIDQQAKQQQQQQQNQPGSGDGNGSAADVNEDGDTDNDNMSGGINTPQDIDAMGTPTDAPSDGDANMPDNLSPADLQKLAQKLEEMKKLINGDTKKTKASKTAQRLTQAISGNSDYEVGSVEYSSDYGCRYKVPVLEFNLNPSSFARENDPVLENILARNLDAWRTQHYATPPAASIKSWYRNTYEDHIKVVNNGLRLGTMLGHKLQIRDQVRDTKHTRLKSGKIDGRLLHQCGYDVMNIFQKIDLDKFAPNVIHISIDASSSMAGPKWQNTQTAVLAIAKAASMIQNIAVEVSYRYNFSLNGKGSIVVVNAYNSKKHKIDHMAKVALLLAPTDCTADSLCIRYQLNKKRITPGSSEVKSYFINFSDGGPGCTVSDSDNRSCQYGGPSAHRHIEKCRKDMEAMNVNILSYFIGNGNDGGSYTVKQFKQDWGITNSAFINVTEILPLAKSLNQMFLTK